MITVTSNYKPYNPSTSVGVYYYNETHQAIGYWKSKDREDISDFVIVSIIEINCKFQKVIVQAIKDEINKLLN